MEQDMGKLAVLDIEGFPMLRQWYLVHRKGKRLANIAVAFRDFLLNQTVTLAEK
jgi:DNA-binding transcriptional LysR family regulator